MKKLLLTLALTFSAITQSAEITMTHFPWKMNDIQDLGLTKEYLYKKMDRDLIKLGQSICANRALMWLYEFEHDYSVDGSKIFLFYTNKTGKVGRKTWWYHVSPIINEASEEWVMDAGFPEYINSPLKIGQWIEKFIGSTNCHEISPTDTDLIKRMFSGQTFPETTYRGSKDCYFVKAPAGYWFPSSVAMNLLGHDSTGRPVRFVSEEINKDEVYSACKEAVTTPLGKFLGFGKRKCKKFLD